MKAFFKIGTKLGTLSKKRALTASDQLAACCERTFCSV